MATTKTTRDTSGKEVPVGTPTIGSGMGGYNAVPARTIIVEPEKGGVPPTEQGPNEQSIVASGMTVEEWKAKHPTVPMGPEPEEIGQVTTDPPDDSEPEEPHMERIIVHKDAVADAASAGKSDYAPKADYTPPKNSTS